MKKYILVLIFLSFFWSAFAFEGISKTALSTDGYTVRLYQIDKSVSPDSYEFYVQLKSNNSQEFFTWCFDNLKEAMEHFEWIKTINVVEIEQEKGRSRGFRLHGAFWNYYTNRSTKTSTKVTHNNKKV